GSGSSTVTVCVSGGSTCGSIYVTVGGTCYGGSSYCGSGNIWFNPSNPSLYSGQSLAVSINSSVSSGYGYSTYGNYYYVSNNSNSSVVSASVSGSVLNLTANQSGTANITVCSSALNFCGTLTVTVSGGSCGYYGCGNNLSLSQSSVNLNVGQTAYVTASNYSGNLYVSSNSNSSAVSVSISGSQISLYGLGSGSSTVTVCASGSQCGSIYVTVGGYSGGVLTLSQTNVNLAVGQSTYVSATSYLYGSANLYVSQNSNPAAVSATASGNSVYLSALAVGNSNLTICANYSNSCATVYVAVGGGGGLTFSPSSPTVNVGQTISVAINNNYNSYGLVLSSNTNSSVASVSIYGSTLNIYGISGGTTTATICTNNNVQCGSIYITVSGGSGSGLLLSQSSLNLAIGQSSTVSIYGGGYGYGNYYVASNSNSSVASATVTGNSVNVYANYSGFTAIVICQNNASYCGTLNVSVGGGAYNQLRFLTTSLPTMTVGQYYNVNLQASGGNPPYNFSLISGSLPSGLSLSSSGTISGVPQSATTATFYVSVRDNTGQSISATFYIQGLGYSAGSSGGSLSYPGSGGVLGASTYPNGELISEYGTVYIVYKNTKTGFVSAAVFRGLGFSFSNVSEVGNSGLADSGYTIRTANASHPWGSWIKSGQTVYFVHESGLIPVPDWSTFLNNGGQSNMIVSANHYDFTLPILSPMSYNDSRLR
ncbi:MAG: hypothetical protein KGJ93_03830, partial [Patescibacteria group bacterium]|nr:hypothetical protein [Patescibacteria group bacterium]